LLKAEHRQSLLEEHGRKHQQIKERLKEFSYFRHQGTDEEIFAELAYCVLTANTSAKMGERCLPAIRPVLMTATLEEFKERLHAVRCRFWNTRSSYLVHIREHLDRLCGLKLKTWLEGFPDLLARRDALAVPKEIKGIAFKESSHFLRNIGYRGYAILDLHIVKTMKEFGLIRSEKRPSNRDQYLKLERKLSQFSEDLQIDLDELDLLLWSRRTGEILK